MNFAAFLSPRELRGRGLSVPAPLVWLWDFPGSTGDPGPHPPTDLTLLLRAEALVHEEGNFSSERDRGSFGAGSSFSAFQHLKPYRRGRRLGNFRASSLGGNLVICVAVSLQVSEVDRAYHSCPPACTWWGLVTLPLTMRRLVHISI